MDCTLATRPGRSDVENEDFAAAAPGVAVLVDGATAPPGLSSGCVHSVAWYARTLGSLMLAACADPRLTLAAALETAIEQVTAAHAGTCDVTSPHSPSATVAAARLTGDGLDYLALCDSTVLVGLREGAPLAVTDTRLDALRPLLAGASPRPPDGHEPGAFAALSPAERFAAYRNHAEGFWVAGTVPAAARQAVTGTVPRPEVASVTLFTDGASRYVDLFGLGTWRDALGIVTSEGPDRLLDLVRAAEESHPAPRAKRSDDATVLHWPLPR